MSQIWFSCFMEDIRQDDGVENRWLEKRTRIKKKVMKQKKEIGKKKEKRKMTLRKGIREEIISLWCSSIISVTKIDFGVLVFFLECDTKQEWSIAYYYESYHISMVFEVYVTRKAFLCIGESWYCATYYELWTMKMNRDHKDFCCVQRDRIWLLFGYGFCLSSHRETAVQFVAVYSCVQFL